MKNNLLDYASVGLQVAEEIAADFETVLTENDDGEGRSVKDSKAIILNEIDNAIKAFTTLRDAVKTTSLSELRKDYHIEG